jgi:hypothetical protein
VPSSVVVLPVTVRPEHERLSRQSHRQQQQKPNRNFLNTTASPKLQLFILLWSQDS